MTEGASKEEAAYDKFKSRYGWLTLECVDGKFFLGCRECMAKETTKPKRGFAAGKYTIDKYFYERTLTQHISSSIHKASDTPPLPDSPLAGSPPSQAALDHTPPRSSSARSVQKTPESSDHKGARKMFRNLLLAVFTVLKQCLSSAMFSTLLMFASRCGGLVPEGQQSATVFDECRELVASHVLSSLVQEVQQSPYFAVSVDEKDCMLVILVTFISSQGKKITAPLGYKNLPGFEAKDLFEVIRSTLEENNLSKDHMIAFCADGASVMGSRQSMSGNEGNNVAHKLQSWCGHPLLVQHCAPHKLQLAVASAFHQHEYFKSMEKRITALFNHLSNCPAATIDLLFWSVSTSSARWMSWLKPLEKIQNSYLSLISHLLYQFSYHANKEAKKTIQWIFLFMSTWQFRLTVAGCIDILRLCFHTKNLLESVKSLTAVQKFACQLDDELTKYCRKNSILAEALAGETDLPRGGTEIEKMADLYRSQRGKKLRLTYTLVGGEVLDEAVSIKGIDSPEDMKAIFRRLKDFAENCQLQVLRRFDAKEVWKHGHIFDLGYQHTATVVQTAVHDIAAYLKIDTRPCLDQMRTAFAIRDVLLKQEKFEQAEDLWVKVLADLKVQQLACAGRLVASFVLAPSQAAACERSFSVTREVYEMLGRHTSPQVVYAYLLVSSYGPDPSEASHIVSECTTKFLQKERRQSTPSDEWYRHGRRMLPRKRKQRSDKGEKRAKYTQTKRNAGLQAHRTARRLVRGEGGVSMEPVEEDVAHPIFDQLSPRRHEKKRADRDDA